MSNVEDCRDYGAFIPSFLDDFGLDMPCFRLYAHIARRAGSGLCWESIDKMAKTCQMNRKTAYKAFNLLQEHKLILVEKRIGQTSLITLTNHSVWIPIPNKVQVKPIPNKVQPYTELGTPPIPDQGQPPIPDQVYKGIPSEGIPKKEKENINFPLDQKQENLSDGDKPKYLKTPPVAPPAPRNYAQEMGDCFRDAGNKPKQVKAWQENDLFVRFIHKDLAQKSEYYKNQPYESAKHYIGKSRLTSPDMVLRFEELSDHYQNFLKSQQRSQQQPAPIATQEDPTTYTVPSFVKDFAKSRKAS